MSALPNKCKESFLTQNPSIDWDTDTIKVSIGRTSAYTYSAAHQYKSSVTTVQDASAALGSKVATDGVADAADATFAAVTSGAALDFMYVWKDTGNAATSPLILYVDGFSVTPNGGDITAQWDNGAPKIFAL